MSENDKNESQIDLDKIVKVFCNEMSNSMVRIEAERDFQKEAINNIHEKTGIEKNVLKFCAKTYHKQNFEETQERLTEEQEFYIKIFGEAEDVSSEDTDEDLYE